MPEVLGWGAYVLASGPLMPRRGPGVRRALCTGVWPVCRLAQPSACMWTPAAQDHVSRGGGGLAGSRLQPALRQRWCHPCRGVLDQVRADSVPAGVRSHGGRLSGSLSGFRFLGNQVWDRQTAGSLSPRQAPFTPCCSSRAPPCPLTQDTEGRARSQQGPVGAPGPPCLPGRTGPGTARRTAEWLALLLQAVWPLPVGHRPPGPALPVPAQPPTLAWPGRGVVYPHFTDENTEAGAGT